MRSFKVATRIVLIAIAAMPPIASGTASVGLQSAIQSAPLVFEPSEGQEKAGVRLLGRAGDYSVAQEDTGNANPDCKFRYESSLGGYVFNLSPKSHPPGTTA